MHDDSQDGESSLGRQAYQALRRALRDRAIVPKRFYSETEFAELLGVSRTPVREALKALERDGVVIAARRRGYRIREFSDAEIDEIVALREQLEVLVVRTLATAHGPDDLAPLADILRRQDEDTAGKHIFALDEEFHLSAAELAGLHRTRTMLEGLRSVTAAATAGVVIPYEATAQRVAEHHQIFVAIAEGDPDKAAELMRAHIHASDQRFRQAIREAASGGPMIKPLNRERPSPAPG
jgi:GntR family transcriptional regulator, rspAB operon transcriptional repressor